MAMLDLRMKRLAMSATPVCWPLSARVTPLHLPWPDDPIEPFQIGRLLWKINWMAGHEPQWLPNMVERYVPVFENYEKTGKVVLM